MSLDLSILVVSFNTRDVTLACIRSIYEQTIGIGFEVIVVDNASSDGSADAIAEQFPQVRLLRRDQNLGFAAANNLAAALAGGEFLLLLNPDTVVLDGAVQKLLQFSRENPSAGVCGGRTLFADRSLNPTSCWAQPTLWSTFCRAVGLSSLFRGSRWFDSEAMGDWQRDSVRQVDIVTGCFFMISTALWRRLGGFDPAYFMYCEEADLCLRARKLGFGPMITPDATIIHLGGLSESSRADKTVKLLRAKLQMFSRHWSASSARFGAVMMKLLVASRVAAWWVLSWVGGASRQASLDMWTEVWRRRGEWLGEQPCPGVAHSVESV